MAAKKASKKAAPKKASKAAAKKAAVKKKVFTVRRITGRLMPPTTSGNAKVAIDDPILNPLSTKSSPVLLTAVAPNRYSIAVTTPPVQPGDLSQQVFDVVEGQTGTQGFDLTTGWPTAAAVSSPLTATLAVGPNRTFKLTIA